MKSFLRKFAQITVASSAFAGFVVLSTEIVTQHQDPVEVESVQSASRPRLNRNPASLEDFASRAERRVQREIDRPTSSISSGDESRLDSEGAADDSDEGTTQKLAKSTEGFGYPFFNSRRSSPTLTRSQSSSDTKKGTRSINDIVASFSNVRSLTGPSVTTGTSSEDDDSEPESGSGTDQRSEELPVATPPQFDGLKSITEVGKFSVRLNWTSEDAVTSYNVYSVASGVPTFLETISAPASGTVITTLLVGTTYTFRVRKVMADATEDDNEVDLTITTDVDAPAFSASSVPENISVKGGDAINITWTATDVFFGGTPVAIHYSLNGGTTWTSIAANQTASGSYNWTTPAANSNRALVRLTATNTFGKSTSVVSPTTFTIDTQGPSIQAGSFKLNGSTTPGTTSNVNVSVEFRAQDSVGKIEQFCMKYNDTTAPGQSDDCWINVALLGLTPLGTISVTLAQNYFFQTAYVIGAYDCYLWVKDAAGNMSTLSNVLGTDRVSINYDPGIPPTISAFQALGVDNPSNPPLQAELQINSGNNLYFRWRATDDTAILPGSISLYYLDPADSTWKGIPGASALSNTSNGGCTADDPLTALSETGCFLWSSGSPSSLPYQVRIVVKDSDNQTQQTTSAPVNTGNFRVIAGNTDPGLDGSARTAVLFPSGAGEVGISNQFVVTPNGYVYIMDSRGVLRIKPEDGALRLFIPNTGVDSTPGTSASTTTVSGVLALTLDSNGRVLMRTPIGIMRFEGNQSDPVITRVIGGGGSTADGVVPSSFQISGASWQGMSTLIASPDGRIYFDDNAFTLRYLDPVTNTIRTIPFSGVGMHGEPGIDVSTCVLLNFGLAFNSISSDIETLFAGISTCPAPFNKIPLAKFNPATFESLGDGQSPLGFPFPDFSYITKWYTGVNGKLYGFNFGYFGNFYEYKPLTNSVEIILGQSIPGYCEDGALANTCLAAPQSMFVDKFGKIYFMENGLIRVIQDDGRIRTLYGAWSGSGDGGSALAARMTSVNSIGQANDGSIQIMQTNAHIIREFTSGGVIQRLIGNGNSGNFTVGSPALTSPLNGLGPFNFPNSFAIDPVTKNMYITGNADRAIYVYHRATGLWGAPVVGGGATEVPNADGLEGTQILTEYYYPKPLLYQNNLLTVSYFIHYGPAGDRMMIKTHDALDNMRQYHVAGNMDLSLGTITPCANGMSTNSCYLDRYNPAYASMAYDPVDDKFLFSRRFELFISKSDNTVELRTGFGQENSMAYRRIAGTPDQEIVYWCNGSGIIKRDLGTNSETVLMHPVLGITCAGQNMIWNDTDKKLIFPFKQNNLWGIAEIYDP